MGGSQDIWKWEGKGFAFCLPSSPWKVYCSAATGAAAAATTSAVVVAVAAAAASTAVATATAAVITDTRSQVLQASNVDPKGQQFLGSLRPSVTDWDR